VEASRDSVRVRPETPAIAAILALAGGSLDGIVFSRYGVFANAQTGNLVLFALGLAQGRWSAFASLVPVGAFALGVAVAQGIARARAFVIRPTRVALGLEVAVLILVALLPPAAPSWMTVLPVSFAAAVQASSFRSLAGQPYSTTMSTGNLRSFVLYLVRAFADHDPVAARAAGAFGVVLTAFCVGAGVGALIAARFGSLALALPATTLVIVLVLIVHETATLDRRPEIHD
jgi:uncharacterized membrane protein YoaK (UPF0700 family)